ncbi:adenine nucleotide alpha hydrolases-like protein [Hymenopellis radicata]|nr:adenine nucleotide alpha hydrolases-like protein [Hymenopellis radicata]
MYLEELDSYMYQTVGQDAIEFVAKALDVPLYRRVIRGTAVEQGAEYGGRASTTGITGDETEDLYELLAEVKSKHPDIAGVSVGAILSNYQRVRVEHVCRRLSLVALCYLWQRSQAELLLEMIGAGMHVVLIKVAGIGLTKTHLGKSLGEMEETLFKLNALYGSHICGEGGEYESLTLDCPLFKSRIQLDETEVVIHSDNDFASVAYLRIKSATLVPKSESFDPTTIRVPPLLDGHSGESIPLDEESLIPTSLFQSSEGSSHPSESSIKRGNWVSVANIQTVLDTRDLSISDEVSSCFELLREKLSQWHLQLSDCVNINLFISSMDLFTQVNAVYAAYFGTSPPARACVAVDLPSPYRVRLDCVAYNGSDRQALHVQSLSYWAPANIGPYSQSILADARVFVSGQIGMIPKDLSLPSPRSLTLETALSTQHADRIVAALSENSGGWHGHSQLVVFWLSDPKHFKTVSNLHFNLQRHRDRHAGVIYASVKAIPKAALVEKQVLLHTGRFSVDDDGEVVAEDRVPLLSSDSASNKSVRWQISNFPDGTASCLSLSFSDGAGINTSEIETLRTHKDLQFFWKHALSVRLFHVPSIGDTAIAVLQELFGSNPLPVTMIPCQFLATPLCDKCDFIICILTT